MELPYKSPAAREKSDKSFTLQAYEKAVEKEKQGEIDMDSFKDLYGEENVEKDKKEVKRLKDIFDSKEKTISDIETERLAKVLEIIFYENIELSEWLGSNAYSIKTAPYDDYKNGVDIISEFIENEDMASYLGLAVDATFSKDLSKKFDRIKKDIREGHLSRIKYFDSEMTDMRGELSNVPRVVIGAVPEKIRELAQMWVEGRKKDLGKDVIQFNILEEILMQLKAFKLYARKYDRENLAQIYNRLERRISKVLAEKEAQKTQGQLNGLRKGVLFERIKKETESMVNEALQ